MNLSEFNLGARVVHHDHTTIQMMTEVFHSLLQVFMLQIVVVQASLTWPKHEAMYEVLRAVFILFMCSKDIQCVQLMYLYFVNILKSQPGGAIPE